MSGCWTSIGSSMAKSPKQILGSATLLLLVASIYILFSLFLTSQLLLQRACDVNDCGEKPGDKESELAIKWQNWCVSFNFFNSLFFLIF